VNIQADLLFSLKALGVFPVIRLKARAFEAAANSPF